MISINRKVLCFAAAAITALSLEVGCMNRSELEEEKRQLLSDMEKFNRAYGMSGWDLEGVQFTDENLAGIRLFDSRWENVGLENINLSGCELRNTVITGSDCYSADFSDAVMENVRFENCSLDLAVFEGARLKGCEFSGCRSDEIRMKGVTLEGCEFREHQDEAGIFDNGKFHDTVFRDSRFNETSFYSAAFEDSEFRGGGLENSYFSGSRMDSMKFTGLDADFCSFSEVTASIITFSGCGSGGISFVDSELEEIKLDSCGTVNLFSLSQVRCRRLSIAGCELISEPMFYKSVMENIDIAGTGVEFLDGAESEYTGAFNITECLLHGMNLSGSKVSGMRISSSRIENFLYISEARFEGLELEEMEYAPDLKVRADSVEYISADRFPGT